MALFQRVCELDLEGIVAKQKFGPYVAERDRALGSRFSTPNIRRGEDAKNCLSGTGTVNLLPAGIAWEELMEFNA